MASPGRGRVGQHCSEAIPPSIGINKNARVDCRCSTVANKEPVRHLVGRRERLTNRGFAEP
jgi:hypothetical protein